MAAIINQVELITLTLNNHLFTSFVAGDILELTPQNDYSSQIVATGGGVNIQKRSDANVHDLIMRIQKHSDDDVFMNIQVNSRQIVVFDGSLKQNYIKDGVDSVETYILALGSIMTLPTDTVSDLDGSAVREYVIRFNNVTRNV